MMDTEFDQEGLDKAVFCRFCVRQARFLEENHEPTIDSRLPIWWKRCSREDIDFDYKYFLDDVIHPCKVTIPVISKELLHKHCHLANSGTIRTHNNRRPVISNCIYCAAQLESKLALVRHVKKEHQNDLTFKCKNCKIFFLSSQEKKRHHETFHPILKLKCPLCFEQNSTTSYLASHMKLWHNTVTFLCKYMCGAFFLNDKLHKEHCREVHETEFKKECIYCKKYYTKNNLYQHVKLHHKSIYIKCNFNGKCTSFFHTEEERERHNSEVHKNGAGRLQCIYCQRWQLKTELSAHVKDTHRLVRIRCPYWACITYFHTQEEKQKHILEVHESGEDKYRCIYFNMMVPKSTGLIIGHMQYNHKTEAIKCDYQGNCPNYFLTQEEKQKHILEVHEKGDDKIRCEFCHKMVKIKVMKCHIKNHHQLETKGIQEEKVECIYCKKQIKKCGLASHMSLKHKTEVIKCDFSKNCRTYFLNLEDRLKHVGEVHLVGKQVHVSLCQFCQKVYSLSASLKVRIKKRHPEVIKCKSFGCFEYFLSKRKQKEHYEKAHALQEKGKTFRCFHCTFVATSREEKDAHSAQVHTEATVQCPECPKMFKSKNEQRSHIDFCHGEKQECPHCRVPVNRTSLTYHLQRTSCPTCKAAFVCRGYRKKHSLKCLRSLSSRGAMG